MPTHERKGTPAPSEPPEQRKNRPAQSRWRKRFSRVRNEVGLHLIRGAATAVGGAAITFTTVWLQTHI